MKTIKNSIVTMVLIAALPLSSFAKGIEFQEIGLNEALELSKKEHKALFIDIYATWCGPCKYLSKNIFTDHSLGDFMNENFICIKLDGEKLDGGSLMQEFKLSSYPTMLFLDENKKLLKKLVGAVPAEKIIKEAKEVKDPTTSKIYPLHQEYEKGNRDREFLAQYIDELTNIESDKTLEVVEDFIELFPNLDLMNERELLVFCLGIEDLNHPLTQKFIRQADRIADVNLGYAQWKSTNLFYSCLEQAVSTNDLELLSELVDQVYPAYAITHGDEALSKEAVLDELMTGFKEITN